MVRLKRGNSGGDEPKSSANVELMEDLVRATLKMNPRLRDGKDTMEVMESLRNSTVKKADSLAQSGEGAQTIARQTNSAERGSLAFFLQNKAREWAELGHSFSKQRQVIDAQEVTARDKVVRELVDFLTLSCPSASAVREALTGSKELLAALGLTEKEFIDRSEQRRRSY